MNQWSIYRVSQVCFDQKTWGFRVAKRGLLDNLPFIVMIFPATKIFKAHVQKDFPASHVWWQGINMINHMVKLYIYIYIPWSFHYSWYSMISPLIFLLFPWYSHYFPLIFLLKSYLSKLPAAARTSKQGAHGPAALSLGTLDQNVLRMVGISLVTSGYSWYVYRWFSYIYI